MLTRIRPRLRFFELPPAGSVSEAPAAPGAAPAAPPAAPPAPAAPAPAAPAPTDPAAPATPPAAAPTPRPGDEVIVGTDPLNPNPLGITPAERIAGTPPAEPVAVPPSVAGLTAEELAAAPDWVKDPTKYDPVAAWRKQQNQAADLTAARQRAEQDKQAAVAAAVAARDAEVAAKLGYAAPAAPAPGTPAAPAAPGAPQNSTPAPTQVVDQTAVELRQLRERVAVEDAVPAGINSTLMLTHLRGTNALAGIDLTAADAAEQVSAAITTAVTQYPQHFRAEAQVAPRSGPGVPPTGDPIPTEKKSPESIDDWLTHYNNRPPAR